MSQSHELRHLKTPSKIQSGSTGSSRDYRDEDAIQLARTGKKQVLKRRFGIASLSGFAGSIMITWEGTLVDFLLGLEKHVFGGPAGLIYGYLVAFIGTLSVFITLSELASMCPTAGGQYHWTSLLAPRSVKLPLSYVTGWLTVMGWIMSATTVAYWTGTMVAEVIALNNPHYQIQGWHGTLLMWATLLFCTSLNTIFGAALPIIEIFIFVLHILGFIATFIPLIYLAPKTSAKTVFTSFYNLGGWQTKGLAFFVGLRGNVGPFIGPDGVVHMSEEVERSTINVPRSIIFSIIMNGITGLGMLITVLFCAGDLSQVAQTTSTYPIINIFATALSSNAASTVLMSIIIVMNACSAAGCLASSSRLMWSFAREEALPAWRWLVQVDRRTRIPMRAVAATVIPGALLGLINVGSSAAFEDLLSLALEAFYVSYFIPVALLLYRRLKWDIREPRPEDDYSNSGAVPVPGVDLVWGPWRLHAWFGIANNIFATVYLVVVGFFCFWPATRTVTALNMNYSSLILGAVMLMSTAYYVVVARKHYKGPVVEVEVVERRKGSV